MILTVAGFVCQASGLVWLVTDANRQRATYGEYGPVRRLLYRVRDVFVYWFSPPSEPAYLAPSAGARTAADMSLTTDSATAGHGIIDLLDEIQQEAAEQRKITDGRLDFLERYVVDVRSDLQRQVVEVAGEHEERRRSSLRLNARASLLFILGAFLSMLGGLIS